MIARTLILASFALLAGCGDDAPATDAEGREASGEVLEGSISDDMLPIEGVRSQPPLADPEAEPVTASVGGASASSPAADEAPARDSAPQPAAEPEPAPEPEPAAED